MFKFTLKSIVIRSYGGFVHGLITSPPVQGIFRVVWQIFVVMKMQEIGEPSIADIYFHLVFIRAEKLSYLTKL